MTIIETIPPYQPKTAIELFSTNFESQWYSVARLIDLSLNGIVLGVLVLTLIIEGGFPLLATLAFLSTSRLLFMFDVFIDLYTVMRHVNSLLHCCSSRILVKDAISVIYISILVILLFVISCCMLAYVGNGIFCPCTPTTFSFVYARIGVTGIFYTNIVTLASFFMWVYIEYDSIKTESEVAKQAAEGDIPPCQNIDEPQTCCRRATPVAALLVIFPMNSCMKPAIVIDWIAVLLFVALLITSAAVDGVVAAVVVSAVHVGAYRLVYVVGTLLILYRFDIAECLPKWFATTAHVVLNLLALAIPITLWLVSSILSSSISCASVSSIYVFIHEAIILTLMCSLANLSFLFVKSSFSIGNHVAFYDVDTITITATTTVPAPAPVPAQIPSSQSNQ
jgi:hypothetical protein